MTSRTIVACAMALFFVACGPDGTPYGSHDEDGDGIVDSLDNCPSVPEVINGFEDLDGCPDTITGDADGDGIPLPSDKCPSEPETFNGYQDDDGCPDSPPVDSDPDHDGIPDSRDACPTQPETQNGYQDADGCPDAVPMTDTDGDGIQDSADACPTSRETANGYRDSDGCPDLSGSYSGRWSGQATLQFQNEPPWFNNTVLMTGTVDGDHATMSPVCPLGDVSFTTNGYTDQFSATWQGSMNCAPIAFTNGCQYVVITYTDAAFSLSSDGQRLGAAGGGTASGCGITKPFQMTFSGVRQ